MRLSRLPYLTLFFLYGLLSAQTNEFTDGAGDGLWSNPDNWSLGSVPTATQDVIIPGGRTATISASAGTRVPAGSVVVRQNGVLGFKLDDLGVAVLDMTDSLVLETDAELQVDGMLYESLDGYFPLMDIDGTITGFNLSKVRFSGLDSRSPALVEDAPDIWLRLTAPPPYSVHLGSLVPPSTVEPDYENDSFSVTRSLQPNVSAWTPTLHEAHVMDTTLSSQLSDGDPSAGILSWEARVGHGGHLYSLRTPTLGETVPPSWRSDPNDSPWNDEVWQAVAVDTALNHPDGNPPSKYFLHQSGVYMRDPVLKEPFYSPQVAWRVDPEERAFTTVNWIQHPHLEVFQDASTDNNWRSDVLCFTRYRDLGQGTIEVTMGLYNYGSDTPNRHNLPWGGVRRTSMEYAFLSNPDGQSWGPPVTEDWGEGRTDWFRETGGWIAFSDAPDGSTPGLALVYGKDPLLRLPQQFRDSLIRLGYAGGTETGNEADWRNYLVATVVRHYTLNRGDGVWARFYFVLGSDLTDLADRIAARNLADGTEMWPMEYTESSTPVIGYSFSGSGETFEVFRETEEADFYLYAYPVTGSFPIYEIIENDGSCYLTWDPYVSGTIKTYDGTIAGIRLLGFAPRQADINTAGTDHAYQTFDTVVSSAPLNYKPSGETLAVRVHSAIERWRLDHFGTKANAGPAANTADPDFDGAVNLLEYGLGGVPTISDSALFQPSISAGVSSGQPYTDFLYSKRRDAQARYLFYLVKTSPDLSTNSWREEAGGIVSINVQSADFESVKMRFSLEESLMARLQLTLDDSG